MEAEGPVEDLIRLL